MKPLSPFELIKQGAMGLIDQGKSFFTKATTPNYNDQSTSGLIKNTIAGLPQAGSDTKRGISELASPTYGRSRETLKKNSPFTINILPNGKLDPNQPERVSWKETATIAGKSGSELFTAFGKLGEQGYNVARNAINKTPLGGIMSKGFDPIYNKFVESKTGGLLAGVTPSLEKYQIPVDDREAALLSAANTASNFIGGVTKNVGAVAKTIAGTKNPEIIVNVSKRFGLKDEVIKDLLPSFIEAGDPKTVADLITQSFIPPHLQQKAIELEIKKEALNGSPFSGMDKRGFTSKEGDVRELGDIRGKVSDKMETAMAESGITDPKDFSQKLEQYKVDKAQLMAEEKAFKQEMKSTKLTTEATPNESRFAATKEISQEIPSGTSKLTKSDPEIQKAMSGEEVRRSQLEASYNESLQRPIKDASEAKRYFNEDDQIYKEMTDMDSFPNQRKEINDFARSIKLTEKAPNYRDIGNIKKGWKDFSRIFEDVFQKDNPIIKKKVLDPFDDSKGAFIDMQDSYLKGLKENVTNKGFKQGSKEDALIQQFGEKKTSYDDIVKQVGKNVADKIVDADKWFRKTYDELIDQVNPIIKQIYPNSPEKLILKRKDYYRHFTEMKGDLSGLKNIFETPAGIDPKLAGLSPFTEPKSKWASFKQKRLGIKTKESAIGGFLDYLPQAAYSIHIDPNIGRFRALADSLINATDKTGNLNNFIDYLRKFANDLSGKTNPMDRLVTDFGPWGRKGLQAVDWLNRRTKANIILMNARASLVQIANIPQGIASAKQYAAKGLVDSLADVIRPNKAMQQSTFLKERFFRGYDQFDTGLLKNTRRFAVWATQALDQVGTKFIWNSHYEKALAEKIADPVRYADNVTRKLIAGRGIGEVPLAQKSKALQLVIPFQLEVANLWHVMGDMKKKKDFTGLAILFLGNYVMNRAFEKVTGSPLTFDPIQAAIDASNNAMNSKSVPEGILKFGGRLSGEVLSNVPFGQTAANLYPEEGFSVFGNKTPTKKEFFGQANPSRFGDGLLVTKSLQDPLYKILPPFGGGQIQKTVDAIENKVKGGSFTDKGEKRFDAPKGVLGNIQAGVFGQYSTKEGQDYIKGGFKTTVIPKTRAELAAEIREKRESGEFGSAAVAKEYLDEELKKIKTTESSNRLKLSPAEYAGEVRKALANKSISQSDAIKEIKKYKEQGKEEGIKRGFFGLPGDYVKAFTKDPDNAWKAFFGPEKLGEVKGDAVRLKRFFDIYYKNEGGSEEKKKEMMYKLGIPWKDRTKYKLEHITPVFAGGDNSDSNLKIVTNAIHDSSTALEKKLGLAVESGKINRKKAAELMRKLKVDKTMSAEEVINALK